MDLPQNIFNILYPVGAYYITEGESPQSIFSSVGITSTWTKVQGRVLIGTGTSKWSFTAGSEGGNSTVPSHTHSFSGTTSSNGAHTHQQRIGNTGSGASAVSGRNAWGGDPTYSAGAHTHTFSGTTDSSGEESTDVLPPYRAVDIWRRTA